MILNLQEVRRLETKFEMFLGNDMYYFEMLVNLNSFGDIGQETVLSEFEFLF